MIDKTTWIFGISFLYSMFVVWFLEVEMKSFDDYFNEEFPDLVEAICCGDLIAKNYKVAIKEGFDLGQQSRQSIIDSLHKNIDALHVENERIQKEYQMMFEGIQGRQKTIDELQRRIDDALKELELLDYFRTGNSDNAIKILKGEQK